MTAAPKVGSRPMSAEGKWADGSDVMGRIDSLVIDASERAARYGLQADRKAAKTGARCVPADIQAAYGRARLEELLLVRADIAARESEIADLRGEVEARGRRIVKLEASLRLVKYLLETGGRDDPPVAEVVRAALSTEAAKREGV